MVALTEQLLAALSLLIWLYLLLARGGFWRVPPDLAPANWAGAPVNAPAKKVVAVIPARDEAAVIADTVQSLLTQRYRGPIHVLVVDDASSDGTAAAATQAAASLGRSAQLTVIPGTVLREGWTGKVWAMSQGAAAAAAFAPDYLLFTDADIHHEPGNIAMLVANAETHGRDLVSYMVELPVATLAEKCLIPAFVYFFLQLYPPRWIASARASTAGAAGPAYDSGGTPTAEMALVDADRAAYHGRYTKALAHDNRAIAISPDFAIAYLVRAHHYMDMGRYDAALADIARLETMHPDSIEVPMARAQIALRHADGAAAMTQMNLAVQMRNRSYWHAPHQGGLGQVTGGNYYVTDDHTAALIFAYTSLAEQMLHQDEASIQDMQHMMNYDSTRPWYVLSQHCYIAAVAGLLDTAELTCQEAIDGDSHEHRPIRQPRLHPSAHEGLGQGDRRLHQGALLSRRPHDLALRPRHRQTREGRHRRRRRRYRRGDARRAGYRQHHETAGCAERVRKIWGECAIPPKPPVATRGRGLADGVHQVTTGGSGGTGTVPPAFSSLPATA